MRGRTPLGAIGLLDEQHRFRDDQHVGDDAAVDMHLGEALALRFDVDQHRREDSGNAGGGLDHLTEQFRCARIDAGGDRAHVPDRGALRVELGADDEQPPAVRGIRAAIASMTSGVTCLAISCRSGAASNRLEPNRPRTPSNLQEALEGAAGKHLGEHRVVLRAEKGEGRNQRAGAGAGDNGEFRPVAALGPAVQQARRRTRRRRRRRTRREWPGCRPGGCW